MYQDPELFEALLKKGFDINGIESNGQPLLHNYISANSLKLAHVQYLLAHGAKVNAVNEDGETALHVAMSMNQSPDVVFCLLNGGGNIFARNKLGVSVMQYMSHYWKPKEASALTKKILKHFSCPLKPPLKRFKSNNWCQSLTKTNYHALIPFFLFGYSNFTTETLASLPNDEIVYYFSKIREQYPSIPIEVFIDHLMGINCAKLIMVDQAVNGHSPSLEEQLHGET